MKHVYTFESFLNESINKDTNHWYQKLSQSHKDYVESEEEENNPDNDWDEEEYGPKFWEFETPVHEYLRNNGMLSIVPAIIEFGESIGLSESDVQIDHYMMNDFSIGWKNHKYPAFSISLEGDEHETQAMIISSDDDRTLHNIIGAHLVVEFFYKKGGVNMKTKWSLTSVKDIPDMIMDLYQQKDQIIKEIQ